MVVWPRFDWDAGNAKKRKWRPFDDHVQDRLRSAFLAGSETTDVTIEGYPYKIHLRAEDMKQVNLQSSFCRKVRIIRSDAEEVDWCAVQGIARRS
jgi:hypothetical protein